MEKNRNTNDCEEFYNYWKKQINKKMRRSRLLMIFNNLAYLIIYTSLTALLCFWWKYSQSGISVFLSGITIGFFVGYGITRIIRDFKNIF